MMLCRELQTAKFGLMNTINVHMSKQISASNYTPVNQ